MMKFADWHRAKQPEDCLACQKLTNWRYKGEVVHPDCALALLKKENA